MSALKVIALACDYDDGTPGGEVCEEESDEHGDYLPDVRKWAAKHEGWTFVDGADFCPLHSPAPSPVPLEGN